eukprot:scaffold317_cov260-Pinguiococcus_pyrenoidosus.AAC.51
MPSQCGRVHHTMSTLARVFRRFCRGQDLVLVAVDSRPTASRRLGIARCRRIAKNARFGMRWRSRLQFPRKGDDVRARPNPASALAWIPIGRRWELGEHAESSPHDKASPSPIAETQDDWAVNERLWVGGSGEEGKNHESYGRRLSSCVASSLLAEATQPHVAYVRASSRHCLASGRALGGKRDGKLTSRHGARSERGMMIHERSKSDDDRARAAGRAGAERPSDFVAKTMAWHLLVACVSSIKCIAPASPGANGGKVLRRVTDDGRRDGRLNTDLTKICNGSSALGTYTREVGRKIREESKSND